MRLFILISFCTLLLSCKVKLASFNPSSSENYLKEARPAKSILSNDSVQSLGSSNLQHEKLLSIDTIIKTEDITEENQFKKHQISIPPIKPIRSDSLPPNRTIEPLGVVSGVAGVLSAAGIVSGAKWRTLIVLMFLGVFALVMGIASLIKIKRNRKKFKGVFGPILGIITSVPALYLIVFLIAYSCAA